MKIRVLLLAIGCSIAAFGAYAQKGVDTGTQFGSGADSARCVENISLFIPYAKAGNFKDAYEFWKITYDECPACYRDWETDRKSTRLNSSHITRSRMPSSA